MSKPKHTIESLKARVEYLQQLNAWLSEKLAEAEHRLGVAAPVIRLEYDGHLIRSLVVNEQPVVFADDIIALIPGAGKPTRRGQRTFVNSVQRLRRIKLGAREVISLFRRDLARNLGMTERALSASFGVSTRTHFIGVVTPLGIESLHRRAPEFCAWVEREAFPQVIARFGKGGAS